MKTHLHLFSIFFILFFHVKTQAQTNQKWLPMPTQITFSGGDFYEGLESYYSKSNCNNEDVVFLKFKNNTNYPITIEWFDGFLTEDLKWVTNANTIKKKLITIAPQTEIKGNCGKTNNDCIISIKSILQPVRKYKKYGLINCIITTQK